MKSQKGQPFPPELKRPRCANIKVFLLCLSLLYFSKAMSGSYMKSSITSIERRFDLPSSVVGIIDGGFEMGNLLVITAVSFFGARFHRPRIIAAGATLMGVGTLLIALPHFIMGRYSYESIALGSLNVTASRPVCAAHAEDGPGPHSLQPADERCQHEARSSLWVLVLVGNALRGIGESPITPLGISFVDDHARADNSAFYLGCLMTVGLIGPAVGFLIGSYCARLFVDLGFINMEEVTISPQDSRWVGAWWLGFLIAGGVTLLTALPLWFFPASVPHEEEAAAAAATDGRGPLDDLAAGEKAQGAAGSEQVAHPDKRRHEPGGKKYDGDTQNHLLPGEPGRKPVAAPVSMASLAKEFVPSLRVLLANPVFICMLINYIFLTNWMAGNATFSAKYMQERFGQTASRSNLVIGAVQLPLVALGIFLGGVICKRLKPSVRGLVAFVLCNRVPSLIFAAAFFFIGCDGPRVAGITVPYPGAAAALAEESLLSPCNARCACSASAWDPVCGADGVTYASPCLAGCSVMRGSGRDMLFQQCMCIGNVSSSSSAATAWNGTAVLGQCPRGDACSTPFLYYLGTVFASSFLSSLSFTPGYMLFIRSIQPDLKSFALGIQILLTRTLGGIPGPIYFGAAIDSTCLKSTKSACSGRGSCHIYDTDAFGLVYIALLVSLFLASVVTVCFVGRLIWARQETGARAEDAAPAPGFSSIPTVSGTSEQGSLEPAVDASCGPRTHLPVQDTETTL